MRFIKANKLITLTQKGVVKNGIVIVNEEGIIEDVLDEEAEIDPLKLEIHEGWLCPGFINTHCHLELSHLKNVLAQHTGIVDFAKGIIKNRNAYVQEFITQRIKEADEELWHNGVVAVGDISNDSSSCNVKSSSPIYYHTFIELIGLNPERAELVLTNGLALGNTFAQKKLAYSFAPHAPYSVSLQLIQAIYASNYLHSLPSSIHNQESMAEDDFIRNKEGDFLKLYEFLNLSINYYEASGKSPIKHSLHSLNNKQKLLLVHNTFSDKNDMKQALVLHDNLYWCMCPNANLYIERVIPDIPLLIKNDCRLTIGTDSLASNNKLSVFNELQTIHSFYPELPAETLLKWACINGAEFLGIDTTFGSIEKGKQPGLNLISNVKAELFTHDSFVTKLI